MSKRHTQTRLREDRGSDGTADESGQETNDPRGRGDQSVIDQGGSASPRGLEERGQRRNYRDEDWGENGGGSDVRRTQDDSKGQKKDGERGGGRWETQHTKETKETEGIV